MTDNETREKKFLLDRVEEAHPRFLKVIKDASPLAVLGSLCIAISGFTGNNFPQAQPFAITSATLFLVGFLASVTYRILPRTNYTPVFTILTYVTSALGITMLLGVLYYFIMQTPLVSDALSAVVPLSMVIVSIIAIVVFWGVRLKFKKTLEKVPKYFDIISALAIISGIIYATLGGLNSLNAFFHLSKNYQSFSFIENGQLTFGLSYFFVASITLYFMAFKIIGMREKKKKNNRYNFDQEEDEYIGCRY